jgi:hypothetical protein
MPVHIFTWLTWQAHGWLPSFSEHVPSETIHIIISIMLLALCKYNSSVFFIVPLLLCICTLYDYESRPASYGVVINILRTFLFFMDHVVKLHQTDMKALDGKSLQVHGTWILWGHPIVLLFSIILSLHSAFQIRF